MFIDFPLEIYIVSIVERNYIKSEGRSIHFRLCCFGERKYLIPCYASCTSKGKKKALTSTNLECWEALLFIHIVHQFAMDLRNIINQDRFAPGSSVLCEEDECSCDCIDLAHFAGEFFVFAALFECVVDKVGDRDLGMVVVVNHVVDEGELLIQQELFGFGELDFAACEPAGFGDHAVKAGERGEGGELRSAVVHAHVRAVGGFMVGAIEDVGIGVGFVGHASSPAL